MTRAKNEIKRINTIEELQRAYPLDSFVADTDVLKKDNTTAFTPTADYQPATKAYVDASVGEVGIELWSGSWSSGNITVDGIDDYKFIMILQQAPCLCYNMGTYIMGVQGYYSGTTHYTYGFYCTKSGKTLTYSGSGRMPHTSGGSHGTATTGSTVTKIIGLL